MFLCTWITCACESYVIMIVASPACEFTWLPWHHMTLNSTLGPLRPHTMHISQRNTGISTMWTDWEKSCYTFSKVPLTKSRLGCGLLLSPGTTDYSRIKEPTCWFSQSAYKICFRLQPFSTIRIFRASDKWWKKESNLAWFSETDSWKNRPIPRELSGLTSLKNNR